MSAQTLGTWEMNYELKLVIYKEKSNNQGMAEKIM